ncbi:hypothetical protein BC829DRAFT_380242 [Chytridium lagenaria]|nr:hypothetical protein BC829DRAFT_380242 [Chytridium lagenaria]
MGKYSRQPGKAAPMKELGHPSSPDPSLWIEFPVATNDSTYLQVNVSKHLINGLTHILMTRPKDPIDALGRYLVETDERRLAAEELARRRRDEELASMPTQQDLKKMQSRFKTSIWAKTAASHGEAHPDGHERVSMVEPESREDGRLKLDVNPYDDGVPYAADEEFQSVSNLAAHTKHGFIPMMGPPASTTPPFSPPKAEGADRIITKAASPLITGMSAVEGQAEITITETEAEASNNRAEISAPSGEASERLDTGNAGLLALATTGSSRAITPALASTYTDAVESTLAPEIVSVEDLNVDHIEQMVTSDVFAMEDHHGDASVPLADESQDLAPDKELEVQMEEEKADADVVLDAEPLEGEVDSNAEADASTGLAEVEGENNVDVAVAAAEAGEDGREDEEEA